MKCPHCKHKLTRQDIAKLSGKLGGSITKTRHGKAFYSQIGKKGMASRWGTTERSTPKK